MNTSTFISLALDPARIFSAQGLNPDPWQRELLLSPSRQLLLCCSRQAGKSTVVSTLALHTALFTPGALVLLLSPSLRQSAEIFRKVLEADAALGHPVRAIHRTQLRLEFTNGSRILSLPGREETIRSFGGVNLLVLDEAARIPDALYSSVRPMLAVSQGRLVALSTPFGRRGWFYNEWVGSGPWHRVQITWRDCPRISPAFIEEERRAMGSAWIAQEYETTFTSLAGLVYPEFAAAAVATVPILSGRTIGGIDFGWRNPFAAVWGVLDANDVLWIIGERYQSQATLESHAAALLATPTSLWHADPAGPTEIAALCSAGLSVRRAPNDIRPGIAAVTARLQSGRLRILAPACPHLLREATLYRYPTPGEGHNPETPLDEHNHALAALRYLVAGTDTRVLARLRRTSSAPPADDTPDDTSLWTPLS